MGRPQDMQECGYLGHLYTCILLEPSVMGEAVRDEAGEGAN